MWIAKDPVFAGLEWGFLYSLSRLVHSFPQTPGRVNGFFAVFAGGVASSTDRSYLIAPPDPPRSLTVVPSIRIEGTTVRLRRGPQEGRVQGSSSRGPEDSAV